MLDHPRLLSPGSAAFHATTTSVLVSSERNWLLIRADGFEVFEFELRLIPPFLVPSSLPVSLSFFSFPCFLRRPSFPLLSSSFFSSALCRLFKSILLLGSVTSIEISFFLSFPPPFHFLPILSTISVGSLELQIMQRTVPPPRDEFLKNYKSRVQTSASRSIRGGGFRAGEGEREGSSHCWFRQERIG